MRRRIRSRRSTASGSPACLACGLMWDTFKRCFGIPHILEFYAATEGNLSLYNVEDKPGAIGRVPSFLAHRFPAEIVKFDVARGEPLRDANGLCVRCGPNEIGEALGRIEHAHPGSRFDGYTDARESDKKILRDVRKAGDAWFRTGDLMRKDDKGYFYFVDRVGDMLPLEEAKTSRTLGKSPRRSRAVRASSRPTCTGSRSRRPTAAPAWRRWWLRRTSTSRFSIGTWSSPCRTTLVRCSCGCAPSSRPPRRSSTRRTQNWASRRLGSQRDRRRDLFQRRRAGRVRADGCGPV